MAVGVLTGHRGEKKFMETTMKEKPEMVKFMSEKVNPMMAELPGVKAFNPAAPDPNAFSCHGCHTLKPGG
jgi:hypothetical protein